MKIAKVVVHCSDSPDSLDIGASEIRQWHINDRGWKDIGYHYIIRRSGIVEMGRYHNGDSVLEGREIGAHTKGQNSDSLAICWIGRNSIEKNQRESLIKLVYHLMSIYRLYVYDVFGHYEFDHNKTCPNIDMQEFRNSLIHYEKSMQDVS